MKSRFFVVAALGLFLPVCVVTAQPEPDDHDPVPAQEELEDVLARSLDSNLADLTVGDILHVQGLISVAQQQRDYVTKATLLSRVTAGLGHYAVGERGTAFGFFAAEMTVRTLALIGAYFLLPPAVQVRNLNYLQTPVGDIEAQWKSLTPAEYLFSASLVMTGSILSTVVRSFAARDAAGVAREQLGDGTVRFEPRSLGGRL